MHRSIAAVAAGLAAACTPVAAEQPPSAGVTCAFSGFLANYRPIPSTLGFVEYGRVLASGDLGFATFFADNQSGLVCFDISDPARPALLDVVEINNPIDLELLGDDLFVLSESASDEVRLQEFDISDPTDIRIASSIFTFPGEPRRVDLVDGLIVVFDTPTVYTFAELPYLNEIGLLNVSDVGGGIRGAAGADGFYYGIARDEQALFVLDLSDPPVITESARIPLTTTGFRTDGIAADSDRVVVSTGRFIEVIDTTDPSDPVPGGRVLLDDLFDTSGLDLTDDVTARAVGHEAFLSYESVGVFRFDISDPARPALTGRIATPGFSWAMDVSDGVALVSDLSAGVTIIDVDGLDVVDPVIDRTPIAAIPDCASCTQIAIDGDIGYVWLDGNDGGAISVFDLSDPTEPVLLSQYPLGTSGAPVIGMAAADGFLYVAAVEAGLVVIDATDPTNPTEAYTYNPFGEVFQVSLSGDRLAISTAEDAVVLLDIADPHNPFLRAIAGDLGMDNEDSIQLLGDVLYFESFSPTLDAAVLREVDLSDPLAVTRVDYPTPSRFFRMAISDGAIYFVDDRSDLGLVMTADLADLTRFDTFEVGYEFEDILVDGTSGYVVGFDGKVLEYGGLPHHPELVGAATPGFASEGRIAKRDRVLYSTAPGGIGVDLVALDVSRSCAPCPGDFDGNGDLNFFDIAAFLNAFHAQDPLADTDGDGDFDFFDLAAFLIGFDQGCL